MSRPNTDKDIMQEALDELYRKYVHEKPCDNPCPYRHGDHVTEADIVERRFAIFELQKRKGFR